MWIYRAEFSSPRKNVRFRYRLEGWDPGWIDGGIQRSANYSSLPGRPRTRFTSLPAIIAGIWNENGAAHWVKLCSPFFSGKDGLFAAPSALAYLPLGVDRRRALRFPSGDCA